MHAHTSLRQQLAHFNEHGHFPDSDGQATDCHGFYDWFCKDSSLPGKSKRLVAALKSFLKKNPHIDLDAHYVFFKNNCPATRPLYDDFRICSRETGDVVYTVIPRCSHSGMAEIWGYGTDGKFGALKTAWKYRELFV
jgi:hypothetical protein